MSLKKSNSRRIEVAGQKYRWSFFENSGWDDVTVQRATGDGQKLVLQVEQVFAPDAEAGVFQRAFRVTPAFVTQGIEFALSAGWTPTKSGAPFNTSYKQGVFKAR